MRHPDPHELSRREFLRALSGLGAAAGLAVACGRWLPGPTASSPTPSQIPPSLVPPTAEPTLTAIPPTATPTPEALGRVILIRTEDRAEGVRRAVQAWGLNPIGGHSVLLKPNFNSADPAPGSTHPQVLRTLSESLWGMGAGSITIADRSGMGNTAAVMRALGVDQVARDLNLKSIVLDELPHDGWSMIQPDGSHWAGGFPFAKPILEAGAVVEACCLKTHRFGGHFTMSLKNSVGMVGKRLPGHAHDYMNELHASANQRRMIAEVNTAYQPALAIVDGVQAFVSGGPDRGSVVSPGVILAGSDRVALDAVGVAILRMYGTTPEVSRGPIFEQEQIARAVELGLGVQGPDGIHIETDTPDGQAMAENLMGLLTGP